MCTRPRGPAGGLTLCHPHHTQRLPRFVCPAESARPLKPAFHMGFSQVSSLRLIIPSPTHRSVALERAVPPLSRGVSSSHLTVNLFVLFITVPQTGGDSAGSGISVCTLLFCKISTCSVRNVSGCGCELNTEETLFCLHRPGGVPQPLAAPASSPPPARVLGLSLPGP